MTAQLITPTPKTPIVGQNGQISREWYRYFSSSSQLSNLVASPIQAANSNNFVQVNADGSGFSVATPAQTLIDIGGAPVASPTFTGIVTIPIGAIIAGYALLVSPAFTGIPTAPTAAPGTDTAQLATTAFALTGVSDGSNAAAGQIGEFISDNVSAAVALITATPADVASIALTAGDWDVSGNVVFVPASTTVASAYSVWSSNASATVPTPPNAGAYSALTGLTFAAGATQTLSAGTQRISIATGATIYLSAQATFTTSTMSAFGFISARRAR